MLASRSGWQVRDGSDLLCVLPQELQAQLEAAAQGADEAAAVGQAQLEARLQVRPWRSVSAACACSSCQTLLLQLVGRAFQQYLSLSAPG